MDWNSELEEVDLTDGELAEYSKALEESEGFDVPYYPHVTVPGMIWPLQNLDRYKEKLYHYGGLAIQQYNQQHDTQFEIIEVVKVNATVVAGRVYYMTFNAKEIGKPTTVFQARVYAGIKKTIVTFCRKKLQSP